MWKFQQNNGSVGRKEELRIAISKTSKGDKQLKTVTNGLY